jgi:hypothetical protein
VHSEAETQFAAARREKGTTVRRICSQLADGVRSVLLEDDWASALEKPKNGFDWELRVTPDVVVSFH